MEARERPMAIHLPPDVEASIRQKVEGGRFPDAADVVREAMRLLDEQEQQLEALRAKLQVGLDELDRGEGDEWTPELMERLRREADEIYRRGTQPDPDAIDGQGFWPSDGGG
jgi:antitoxin ParD1/3/4